MKNKLSFCVFILSACLFFSCGSDSDSSDDETGNGSATCENDCLDQGGTEDVCDDGCDGDYDCFELCISSGNDAFDCAEDECEILCAYISAAFSCEIEGIFDPYERGENGEEDLWEDIVGCDEDAETPSTSKMTIDSIKKTKIK